MALLSTPPHQWVRSFICWTENALFAAKLKAVKTRFSIITCYGAYRSQAVGQVSWCLLPCQVSKMPDPPWPNTRNKSERISLATRAQPGFCYLIFTQNRNDISKRKETLRVNNHMQIFKALGRKFQ